MQNTLNAPRHFLSLQDLNRDELDGILAEAKDIRSQVESRVFRGTKPLDRQLVGFTTVKPSLRTSASIGFAANYLGGSSKDLGPTSLTDKKNLKVREPLEHVTKVLEGQGYPFLFARVYEDEDLHRMKKGRKSMHIINALSDTEHPLQALADMQALQLARPDLQRPKVVFTGDGNNVATSLGQATVMEGGRFIHTGPESRKIPDKQWGEIESLAKVYGGSAAYMQTPQEAVPDADLVYADVFTSMGQESEEESLNRILEPYQVTQQLMDRAGPQALFGHCMPAKLGIEVTEEVFEGPQSIAILIASCRMDTVAALMRFFSGQREGTR